MLGFTMRDSRQWPAPWLFGLLILPLSIYVGFIWTALPLLLSQAGLTIEQIPDNHFLQLYRSHSGLPTTRNLTRITPMRRIIGTRWRREHCHRNSVPQSYNVTAGIPGFMGEAQPIPHDVG